MIHAGLSLSKREVVTVQWDLICVKRCHHLAAVSWGANKNHLEAAQVYGIVSLPPISTKGRPSLRPPTP